MSFGDTVFYSVKYLSEHHPYNLSVGFIVMLGFRTKYHSRYKIKEDKLAGYMVFFY